MGANKFNSAAMAMAREKCAQLLSDNGYPVPISKLTWSHIRGEVLMVANQNQYLFTMLKQDGNGGTAFNTERRLNQSDVFVVTHINLQCANPASSTSGAFLNLNYGNPNVFTTSGVAAAIIGAYMQGNLNIVADSQKLLVNWPTKTHYKAPIMQQNSWIQYTGATPVPIIDSIDGTEDGIMPCEGNLIISGNGTYEIAFNLQGGMAAVETNGRWILEFFGFLAQNASNTSNVPPM